MSREDVTRWLERQQQAGPQLSNKDWSTDAKGPLFGSQSLFPSTWVDSGL